VVKLVVKKDLILHHARSLAGITINSEKQHELYFFPNKSLLVLQVLFVFHQFTFMSNYSEEIKMCCRYLKLKGNLQTDIFQA
jgi:hypothetical protein